MLPAICFLSKADFFSVYNSKKIKTKKFNRAFDQHWDYFLDLNLKMKIHHFIYSYLLILKHQIWKCTWKCVLCQFWNILAISAFWEFRSKVLLRIFYGSKIILEWITHQPVLDLPSTPFCCTRALMLIFFNLFIFFNPVFHTPSVDSMK